MIQFIFSILSHPSFRSKVQELRKEVMELVISSRLKLAERVLRCGHTIWIAVNGIQMIKDIVLSVYGFAISSLIRGRCLHIGSRRTPFATESQSEHGELRVSVHQQRPVFKAGKATRLCGLLDVTPSYTVLR